MARIDHVAFETDDPERLAAFYEQILDARIVKTEGHPVMAYLGEHGACAPRAGAARRTRRSERHASRSARRSGGDSRSRASRRASETTASPSASSSRDPDGRLIEAITYYSGR